MSAMTIKDWCANEVMRTELSKALSTPAMQQAIASLKEWNMPSMFPKINVSGLKAKDALLLDSAQRAGAQEMLNKLLSLPLLNDAMTRAFDDPAIKQP